MLFRVFIFKQETLPSIKIAGHVAGYGKCRIWKQSARSRAEEILLRTTFFFFYLHLSFQHLEFCSTVKLTTFRIIFMIR